MLAAEINCVSTLIPHARFYNLLIYTAIYYYIMIKSYYKKAYCERIITMKAALQLFSIKDISEGKGIFEALRIAKELGYEGVEFAGYFGKTPEELKSELDRLGLEVAGAHIHADGFADERIDETIKGLEILGAYSTCIPWYTIETAEQAASAGKLFDSIGKKVTAHGIKFGYHNHVKEYAEIDEKLIIDIILENSSPENLFYELDCRHAAISNHNPIVEAIRYSGRIPVLHARDTDMEKDVAVGCGVVDFPTVVKEANGVEWLVVENGNIGSNLEELRVSAEYLKEKFCK